MAIDGDPDYEPLPYLDAKRTYDAALVADGQPDESLDVDAAHVLTFVAAIGVSIDNAAAARRLGLDAADLRARARSIVEQMLTALAPAD